MGVTCVDLHVDPCVVARIVVSGEVVGFPGVTHVARVLGNLVHEGDAIEAADRVHGEVEIAVGDAGPEGVAAGRDVRGGVEREEDEGADGGGFDTRGVEEELRAVV